VTNKISKSTEDDAKASGDKQSDPVNFERLDQDAWRKDLFQFVSRLVHFRTRSNALTVNDTEFIHSDIDGDKRVLVWKRGGADEENPVVVLANFSEYESGAHEYVIPNFPYNDNKMKRWREITRDRIVEDSAAGREGIFPWEAKVYALENVD